jgi:hypothetical protein
MRLRSPQKRLHVSADGTQSPLTCSCEKLAVAYSDVDDNSRMHVPAPHECRPSINHTKQRLLRYAYIEYHESLEDLRWSRTS